MFGNLFERKKKQKTFVDNTAAPTNEQMLNESYYGVSQESLDAADAKFEAALRNLRMGGNVPKLNSGEMAVLEFCHNHDMKEFVKEEFDKHPIRLNDDGELIGENPFKKERIMEAQSPSEFRQRYLACPSNDANDLGIY